MKPDDIEVTPEMRLAEHGERKTVLLKATYDMLKKLSETGAVSSPFDHWIVYDGRLRDGHCLMADIEQLLAECDQ